MNTSGNRARAKIFDRKRGFFEFLKSEEKFKMIRELDLPLVHEIKSDLLVEGYSRTQNLRPLWIPEQ